MSHQVTTRGVGSRSERRVGDDSAAAGAASLVDERAEPVRPTGADREVVR